MASKSRTASSANARNAPQRLARKPSDDTVRHVLAQTFLKRSTKMLERMSASASSEVLKSALSCPTDAGGVANLLSDLAAFGIELSEVDPFVESMARGAAIKKDLLASAGGGLTSSLVSKALGITRQAVDKRRIRRALLAVPNGFRGPRISGLPVLRRWG
ncbi:MAG: hypothetical protein WDO73_16155 [Ignavibacteriota bacterium]